MGASKQVLDTVAIHPEPDLLDSPLSGSPTAPSIPPITPTIYTPSTSPGSLHHRSSLVDLKDWVIDDGPLRPRSPTAILNGYSPKPFEPAPLISFESSPPKHSKAPPLPPRKSSYSSLRSVSAPATSPTQLSASPSANMLMPPDADHSYPPALSRDKLSDGTRRSQGHAQASSVSSFHSVSLSSDSGGDLTGIAVSPLHAFSMEREWTVASTEDGESLDESFENVSAPSSFLPPITLPPRPPKPPAAGSKPPPPPIPPKLPQRPPSQQRGSGTSSLASRGSSPSSISSPILALTPSGSSSAPSLTSTNTRRVPPPLPITSPPPPPHPRSSRPPSARTSVQSTATTTSITSDRCSLFSTTSRTSFSSRTSVSPSKSSKPGTKSSSPRARYDALFIANVRAHQQHAGRRKPPPPPSSPSAPSVPVPVPAKRQNAGWRGLSIDLDQTVNMNATAVAAAEPAPDARLDARIVCRIWLKSGLEPQRLRDIW